MHISKDQYFHKLYIYICFTAKFFIFYCKEREPGVKHYTTKCKIFYLCFNKFCI